jgi:hypothetical protein
MGLLNWKSKPIAVIQRLPSGSFTVDSHGHVMTTTVASDFPREQLGDIAQQVLSIFREAQAASLPLAELSLHFAEFCVTARDMHGGAIIFLSPKNMFANSPSAAGTRL